MEKIQTNRIFTSPSLINVCVDQKQGGELRGRLYHCYSTEPVLFANIVELIRETERLFDAISFPQASTKSRSFVEKEPDIPPRRPLRQADTRQVAARKGALGTFVTNVRFRQNATWQGELYWVEKEQLMQFTNILDFIKKIDAGLAAEGE